MPPVVRPPPPPSSPPDTPAFVDLTDAAAGDPRVTHVIALPRTAADWHKLSTLRNMTHLIIDDPRGDAVPIAGAVALRGRVHLRALVLGESRLSIEAARVLAQHRGIRHLRVRADAVGACPSDAAALMQTIADGFPALDSLCLEHVACAETLLPLRAIAERLRELDVRHAPTRALGCAFVARELGFMRLTALALDLCGGVDDDDLARGLPHLPHLTRLFVARCVGVTPRGVLHAVVSGAPKIRELYVGACFASPALPEGVAFARVCDAYTRALPDGASFHLQAVCVSLAALLAGDANAHRCGTGECCPHFAADADDWRPRIDVA